MLKKIWYMITLVCMVYGSSYAQDEQTVPELQNSAQHEIEELEFDDYQPTEGFDELDVLIDEIVEDGFRAQPLREPSEAEIILRKWAGYVFVQYLYLYGSVSQALEACKNYCSQTWDYLVSTQPSKAQKDEQTK